METQEIKILYTLKSAAGEHLKAKQYLQASVYYQDIVSKFDKAIQTIEQEDEMEKLIKQLQIPTRRNLSLCYLKLSENTSCIQQCHEVLRIEPNCLKTLYRISKAYMNLSQHQEAEKYLKRGFAINPTEEEIQKALSEIQTAKRQSLPVKESFISLKKIMVVILCWPLLIFNFILAQIFGLPSKQGQKQRAE